MKINLKGQEHLALHRDSSFILNVDELTSGGGGGSTDFLEPITYSNLKTKRNNGTLTPGMQYRITDYQCITVQEDTSSAMHQFDIIVTADSSSVLNENARAIQHAGDTYFINSDLSAWELKYSIDNLYKYSWCDRDYIMITVSSGSGSGSDDDSGDDSGDDLTKAYYKGCYNTRFYWTDIEGGTYYTDSKEIGSTVYSDNGYQYGVLTDIYSGDKGVIYYMKDEFGNECGYDFKNIQFVFDHFSSLPSGMSLILQPGYYYYTFSVIGYENEQTIIEDYSLNMRKVMSYDINGDIDIRIEPCCECYDNVIKLYSDTNYYDTLFFRLPANVFAVDSGYALIVGNKLGNCYNNIFNRESAYNILGDKCNNNYFLGSSSYTVSYNVFGPNSFGNILQGSNHNTFGEGCTYNILYSGCENNIFLSDCTRNILNTVCRCNTFESYCRDSSFGSSCLNNNIDSGCYTIKFGNGCSRNKIGKENSYIKFGNNCVDNITGGSCTYISIGNSCTYNAFGDDCDYIYFGSISADTHLKNYYRYIIVETNNRYIVLNATNATSSSKYYQNVKILQGVNNAATPIYKTITDSNYNQNYQTVYKTANNIEVTV